MDDPREILEARFRQMFPPATADLAAEAALSALRAAGHRVVPEVPTEAMFDRFVSRALCFSIHGEGGWSNYARNQWNAMLSGAPGGE